MKRNSIKVRFAAAITIVYIVITALTFLAFQLMTTNVVTKLASDFAVKQAQFNKAKLMSVIQRDLALSLKMAASPVLKRWALDEDNPELKQRALQELERYRSASEGQSITFIPDRSKHNYFLKGGKISELPTYTLRENALSDAWYFRVMREVDQFELNVDFDEKLGMTRVWFNVVITDNANKKIGVCGSSIDITEFINEIVTSGESGVEAILFDSDGAIVGHQNREYVFRNSKVRGAERKTTVYDLIGSEAERRVLRENARSLLNGGREVKPFYLTLEGERHLAAISYLKEINWFSLVLVDTAHVVNPREFLPFFVTTIVSLLIVIIITGLLLKRIVLTPLSRLAESSRQIALGNFEIAMPIQQYDEVGALTGSFNEMARMVKDYTINLENKVHERTRSLEDLNQELLGVNEEIKAYSYKATEALEALRRSEDQLRLILDSTAEAIYGTDLNGNCTFCNSACVCLLGYSSPDDLIGKNMHAQIHYQQKDGTPLPENECQIYRSLQKEEGIHIDDEVFCRADGSCFPVEYWAFPQFRNGEVVGAVATFMDITERIEAQEKLHKLSRAVENSPATVVITNRCGRIEYVNPKFTEISGYLPEEAIGQNPRILNANVQSKEFYRELWATITAGSEWRGEFCNRKKSGEVHWEHASISPLRDDRGDITHFVAVKEDITERRRVAEELVLAKEAADAANRLKSEFLANMSHEIRTPLNAIIGFSELALRTELSAQSHDYVTKISNAGESLLKTINDILDFSKIEADKLDMEETLFSMESMLIDVFSVVQQKALEKKLLLVRDAMPELPPLLVGDPHRLGQVLINLLGNAIKFTESGEVRLNVTRRIATATRVELRFAVRDTGVGLSAESLALLFQPFTQADGSTTRRFGGTGLGLSISKRLVELMGGEILAESTPGTGSVFSFTAWFGIGQVEESRPGDGDGTGAGEAVRREGVNGQDNYNFSGSRVLLVEDNEINRQLAVELLQRVGAVAEIAVNGREALDRLTSGERSYDLVLMDIQMPEMDGYEATRRIRKDGRFSDLPIIAMTAHAMQEERQKIAAAGMDDHITKPVNSRNMFKTMSRHLCHLPLQALSGRDDRDEQEREWFREFPGIASAGLDTKGVLERLDGDHELYLQIVAMFIGNQADAADRLQKALGEQQRELAERIAHTCRGVAGNIGATELQQAAKTLEQAIHCSEPALMIEEKTRLFAAELARVVQALQEGLSAPSADDHGNSNGTGDFDELRVTEVLVTLRRYIRTSDGRAHYYLAECEEELAGLPRAPMQLLRAAVASYDYDAALDVIAELSRKAGVDLSSPEEEELS